jgi:hypothetical protein
MQPCRYEIKGQGPRNRPASSRTGPSNRIRRVRYPPNSIQGSKMPSALPLLTPHHQVHLNGPELKTGPDPRRCTGTITSKGRSSTLSDAKPQHNLTTERCRGRGMPPHGWCSVRYGQSVTLVLCLIGWARRRLAHACMHAVPPSEADESPAQGEAARPCPVSAVS